MFSTVTSPKSLDNDAFPCIGHTDFTETGVHLHCDFIGNGDIEIHSVNIVVEVHRLGQFIFEGDGVAGLFDGVFDAFHFLICAGLGGVIGRLDYFDLHSIPHLHL